MACSGASLPNKLFSLVVGYTVARWTHKKSVGASSIRRAPRPKCTGSMPIIMYSKMRSIASDQWQLYSYWPDISVVFVFHDQEECQHASASPAQRWMQASDTSTLGVSFVHFRPW